MAALSPHPRQVEVGCVQRPLSDAGWRWSLSVQESLPHAVRVQDGIQRLPQMAELLQEHREQQDLEGTNVHGAMQETGPQSLGFPALSGSSFFHLELEFLLSWRRDTTHGFWLTHHL